MSKMDTPAPGSAVVITRASWRDLNALRDLEKVSFPLDAWPLLDMIGILTLPGVVRLKALAGTRLVGFVAGDVRRLEGVAWIATIMVHPDYRRQGIGARLLQACEARLPMGRVKLSVRESNQSAIGMYENFGYREVTRWPRYYNGGEDAVVMEKTMR